MIRFKPATRSLRDVALWLLTVSGGVLAGILIAFAALLIDANVKVARWQADPGRTAPGVIWSAPIEVRVGQATTLTELAGDLLAAGYSKLEALPEDPRDKSAVGVFTVDGDTLRVWTAAMQGPGFTVPEGETDITIHKARVSKLSGGEVVVLRPTVLATIGDPQDRRTSVEVDQLSPWVEPAVLAIEDERFRSHVGVDAIGIARALRKNLRADDTVEGGSTLTQQLAKNVFLTPERTLQRKVREAVLAIVLEAHLTKDEILGLYLGEVYYGQMGGLPLYGIDQASRAWFGKSPELLELPEAALLAGVIAAPNTYSPVRHPEAARERRDLVLDRMAELGFATPEEVEAAKQADLDLAGLEPSMVRRAPYAVDYAVELAEAELGAGALATRGYQVYTYLQPMLQRTAERAVREGLEELDRRHPRAKGAQAALVAVAHDNGGIVAMVGGRSYVDSPFNRALARRQAGSTVKPLTLLAALDARLVTLSDVLIDEPIVRDLGGGRTWAPRNYDGGFVGPITVRTAIEHSRNIPAILLAEQVGASRLQGFMVDLGLSGATDLPSAALGGFEVTPIELAGAYTVFPEGGVAQSPRMIRAITTADGAEVRRFGGARERIADPQASGLAVSVLEGVMRRGTGAAAGQYGARQPMGGKTGTTDSFRDAWFVGFDSDLSVAVWVGEDRGVLGLPASQGALPTWARFMAWSGVGGDPLPRPDGLVAHVICADSGQLAGDNCPVTYTEQFARGTEPSQTCELHDGRHPWLDWFQIFGPSDDADAPGDDEGEWLYRPDEDVLTAPGDSDADGRDRRPRRSDERDRHDDEHDRSDRDPRSERAADRPTSAPPARRDEGPRDTPDDARQEPRDDSREEAPPARRDPSELRDRRDGREGGEPRSRRAPAPPDRPAPPEPERDAAEER